MGADLANQAGFQLGRHLAPPRGSCLESQVEYPEMDNQLVLALDTLAAMVPLLAKVLAAMGLLAAAATQLEECYLLAANQLLRPIAAARALAAPEALFDQNPVVILVYKLGGHLPTWNRLWHKLHVHLALPHLCIG